MLVLRPTTTQSQPEATHARPPEPLTPLTNANGEPVALTPRETDILRCLAQGMTTAAMAKKLFIARVTVRNHIQNILQKLGMHSKLEAVVLANRNNLILI